MPVSTLFRENSSVLVVIFLRTHFLDHQLIPAGIYKIPTSWRRKGSRLVFFAVQCDLAWAGPQLYKIVLSYLYKMF